MNYSNDEHSVQVNFFKPSGKWYCTEAVQWISSDSDIHTEFRMSLNMHLNGRLEHFTAVCLEPCHKHSHPLLVVI